MPNNSIAVFLAGHGTVTRKSVIDFGEYNIIFPAPFGSKFCYAAHNMVWHNLSSATTNDSLIVELKKLEDTYGITSVYTAYTRNMLEHKDVSLCGGIKVYDLSKCEQRVHVRGILKSIEDIEDSLSTIRKHALEDPDIDYNRLTWSLEADESLVCNEADLVSIKEIIITALKNTKQIDIYEHALSYDPEEFDLTQKYSRIQAPQPPYKSHNVIDGDKEGAGHYLKIYINEEAICKQARASDTIPNTTKIKDQAIYVMPIVPVVSRHEKQDYFFLSKILDYLHKIHIFVSKKVINDEIEVHSVTIDEMLGILTPKNTADELWYDFTIPDDANIVWGACREIQDF